MNELKITDSTVVLEGSINVRIEGDKIVFSTLPEKVTEQQFNWRIARTGPTQEKIKAIQAIRRYTTCGLREAKDFVEGVFLNNIPDELLQSNFRGLPRSELSKLSLELLPCGYVIAFAP